MFFIVSVLHLVIPDVPKNIQEQIDRENLLTQRALWEVKPEVLNNLRTQSSSDMREDSEMKESDLSRANLHPNFSRNLNTVTKKNTKKATNSPLSRDLREDEFNDYEYNDDYDNYDEELNDDQLNEDMILSKQESKV